MEMSSQKIVECVPNFSEGKDKKIIDAISEAISSVPGVTLLDVDPGQSTNRTVYTFVGDPVAVVEGALAGAKVAYQLIDMTKHKGEHKRLGALDVCPFIPVSGVTMSECVQCAQLFASKLARELDVPVYLYGFASEQKYRKEVPQIRAGEYEGLANKLKDVLWQPDYGPAKFVPKYGATIVGARKFLVAYNVNLISTKEQAHRIALVIRANRPNGEPGRLQSTQAVGWYLAEKNIAQVSVNILDLSVTGIHNVYEEVVKEAAQLKLPVTGSEIVGMVPLQALLDVAEYYIEKESLFVLDQDQKVHLAINRLGLNSISQFDPNKRIIEYMIKVDREDKLVNLKLEDFVYSVGDRTAAPGGGSVGAAVGALGAGLVSMVAKLSYGKKMFEQNDEAMRKLVPPLHQSIGELLKLVDEDTGAFNGYVQASKLPQDNDEAVTKRQLAMQDSLRQAILVPMRIGETATKIWPLLEQLVPLYHSPTTSDFQVGLQCLKTAVYAAYYNVKINLKMDTTGQLEKEMLPKMVEHVERANKYSALILANIDNKNA